MLYYPVLRQDDFSGGLVTRGSELGLKPNQSPDCLNVHSDLFKTLRKRLGYQKVNSSSTSATANGIYNYRRTESEQYMMGLWGTGLKKMDVVTSAWDGNWDAVTVDANRGTALSSNIIHNTTFSGDCIITTEARDVPQKYDPNDATGYTDIDWQTSHCYVVGDDSSISTGTGAYLKLVIDGTTFDDIDVRSKTTIATVVTAINAHSGLSAKGYAYADANGYLRVISNTRGSAGSVVVSDGTSDTGNAQGEATEVLFSGTTQTGTTIGASIAGSGKYCITWTNRVWIANTSTYPDRVYYCDDGDHTTWNYLKYFDVITAGDVGITGMAILGGKLYVFKRFSIHRVTYLGGTPLLDIKEVKTSIGTASPKSICNVETAQAGEILMFLGADFQVYKFDGYNSVPAGEVIYTYNGISNYCLFGDNTTYGINSNYLAKVHSVNYLKKHWYVLFFTLGADTIPQDAFVFDYYTEAFFPFHFGDDITASTISDDGAGQRKMYMAGANYMWLNDVGNYDSGSTTAINAYYTSGKMDFGSEVQKKSLRNINLTTSSTTTATPLFYHKCDWESSWSTAVTMTAATREFTYDMPRFEELYQWKIADNSYADAFELIRATVIGEKLGSAK